VEAFIDHWDEHGAVLRVRNLAAVLERLAAYRDELTAVGGSRADPVETSARLLHQTLTGR